MPNSKRYIFNELKKTPWKKLPYKKQNWGVWFHSISSYVGRIKPAFAYWLIRICSKKKETILDPFCGVGTVLLESDLSGRNSVGIDLNPYAYQISRAKLDRRGLQNELNYLKSFSFKKKFNLSTVPSFVREFYHKRTLSEILCLRDSFLKDKRYFLLGCLLGICHGHRNQHLSMRTGYIIPYIPRPKPKIIYKEVLPRMIEKVTRMYKDPIPRKSKIKIFNKNILQSNLKNNTIDLIISSPPYYNTIDYVHANRLRLWFSGVSFQKQEKLSKLLIQDKKSYEQRMKSVGIKLLKILKRKGILVFVLGDVHFSKTNTVNTANVIADIYEKIGFKKIGIFKDEIPSARTTIVKFKGQKAIDKKKLKFDRVLIMSK